MIVIALAGLPGAGKSTLAAGLEAALRVPRMDKDRVRKALFGPHGVEYSQAQDDFCAEVLYSTAGYWAARGDRKCAVLDGRTFVLAGQAERLVVRGRELGFDPRFVLCTAPREVLIERIERDLLTGLHPAANRTRAHFEALEREARPLPVRRSGWTSPHKFVRFETGSGSEGLPPSVAAVRVLDRFSTVGQRRHSPRP